MSFTFGIRKNTVAIEFCHSRTFQSNGAFIEIVTTHIVSYIVVAEKRLVQATELKSD